MAPAALTPNRSNFGLPEKGIVFCSFSHDYKINPQIFEVWMKLLKEVPDSVLWLMKLNDAAEINLIDRTREHGVDIKRIIFASRLPRIEDHLARYRLADLFIDTFPYNGHTTASDALRAGLPVVSLCGSSFASRVAASLLHDVEMTELKCNSFEEYYETALRIATDIDTRMSHKKNLNERIESQVWPRSAKDQAKTLAQIIVPIEENS